VVVPLAKEIYNINLLVQEFNSKGQITELLAQQDNPEVTLACGMVPSDYLVGKEADLFEKLDFSKLPNAEGMFEFATAPPYYGEDGVAYVAGGMYMEYYTPEFEAQGWDPPKGLADLADPKYAGRVGLTSTSSTVGVSMIDVLSKLEGAPTGNVDPGIAFAKELAEAGQVHSFQGSSTAVNELFEVGEIWIAPTWSAGVLRFVGQGGPVAGLIPEEGTQLQTEGCYIVKGSENQDAAHLVLNLLLGEVFQATFAQEFRTFPMRPGLKLVMDESLLAMLPMTEDDYAKMSFPDWNEWVEYRDSWHDQWVREVEAGQ
jgi:ABC-type Fe3+ transport system substrate-binding protein